MNCSMYRWLYLATDGPRWSLYNRPCSRGWDRLGFYVNKLITRMHSSRMHTGRSLTVCRSLLPGGGEVSAPGGVSALWGVCSGGCLVWGGVCSRGVCVCSWGMSAPGGGCLLLGGMSARGGGCLLWGVSALVMSAPRGCLLWGCLLWGGLLWGCLLGGFLLWGVVSQHTLRQTPPPCEQNDRQV